MPPTARLSSWSLGNVSYSRSITAICSLFALGAVCIWAGGRARSLALVAVLGALCLPLLAHCRCCQTVIRLASTRYPESWLRIKRERGVRGFLFDTDSLGDPEIAALKVALRRWGTIYAGTMVVALVFVALVASHFR
jgi:hypothetical protein